MDVVKQVLGASAIIGGFIFVGWLYEKWNSDSIQTEEEEINIPIKRKQKINSETPIDNNIEEPPLPKGFKWYVCKMLGFAIPCPQGWSIQEDREQGIVIIVKEKVSKTTGLTISCFPHQPAEFANHLRNNFSQKIKEDSTKIIKHDWEKKLNEFDTHKNYEQWKIEFEDSSMSPPYSFSYSIFNNIQTGTLYLCIFESNREDFDSMWENYGEKMVNGIVLHPNY